MALTDNRGPERASPPSGFMNTAEHSMSSMDDKYDLLMLRIGMGAAHARWPKPLPFRTYEDLEGGRSKIRPSHMKAAAFAAIASLAEGDGYGSRPLEIAEIIRTPQNKKSAALRENSGPSTECWVNEHRSTSGGGVGCRVNLISSGSESCNPRSARLPRRAP